MIKCFFKNMRNFNHFKNVMFGQLRIADLFDSIGFRPVPAPNFFRYGFDRDILQQADRSNECVSPDEQKIMSRKAWHIVRLLATIPGTS